MTMIHWNRDELDVTFTHSDSPVRLTRLARPGRDSVVSEHGIVEIYTASDGHARSALGYVGSELATRLRYVDHHESASSLVIVQRDATTGLEVESRFQRRSAAGLQVSHRIRNEGDSPVTLLAVTSLAIRTTVPATSGRYRLLDARSEWLGESQWTERPLTDVLRALSLDVVGQDARGRYAVISTGGWSTGTVLPTGVLVDSDGDSIAWQAEVTAGWLWELAQWRDGVVLNVSGPCDLEHQFSLTLAPGDEFESAPAGLALGEGRDGALAELTRYRRGLRERRAVDDTLPVVYNDFMNTLMGLPSTEALIPLIDEAAAAGAEYFCIDAGWFTDALEYWSDIGRWHEAPTRFTGGLHSVIDHIRSRGLVPGLWLEPEIVGIGSPQLGELPDDAYFQRFGIPLVDHRRRHLDLRHPAARAHLDETVDRLVAEFGLGYFKLDYNIDPGVGTDRVGSAGAGLLEHGRALREWLSDAQGRHPEVLFENCASGAMRMDYALMSVAHQQSTSDQQDAALSAAVTVSAPASLVPEQAANWAYPEASMSSGEFTLSLVNGIMGRLYLSGHLNRLSDDQRGLVAHAVEVHKQWRHAIAESVPFWPLGLPHWDDPVLALGFRVPDGRSLLAVWSRGDGGAIDLSANLVQVFPRADPWQTRGSELVIPRGPSAAVFEYE